MGSCVFHNGWNRSGGVDWRLRYPETGNVIHKLLIARNYLENNFSYFLLVNVYEVVKNFFLY